MNFRIFKAFLLILFLSGFSQNFSQSSDEPLLEELKNNFKKKYFSVSVVFQTVADFQAERNLPGKNGFNIANMRVAFSGELDNNFGYLLKTNFLNSPAILDAFMNYKVANELKVQAGLFKSPFSKEFLTGAESIDFVNRSQVVSVLAPNRQIGVQLSGSFDGKIVNYLAGVFNGNRYANNNNDNNEFMYAGRLSVTPDLNISGGDSYLEIGINGAYSKDASVNIGGANFAGERMVAGGDVRLQLSSFLISGEYIYADLENINPSGFHATLGYMLNSKNQILFRYDSFNEDTRAPDSNLLIFGYNLFPTQVTELQVNYIVNPDDSDFNHHQLLINGQVAF